MPYVSVPILLTAQVGRIAWSGASSLTGDDLVDGSTKEKGRAQERAEQFLLEFLATGPVWSEEVKAGAKEKGIGKNILWEAKDALAVKASKVGTDRWEWSLPDRDGSTQDRDGVNHPDNDRDASGSFSSNRAPNLGCRELTNSSGNHPEPSRTIPKDPDISRARARRGANQVEPQPPDFLAESAG